MANVFRQFLLDAEHGDIEAVKRNIDHGIGLETRDEVNEIFQLNQIRIYYVFIQDQQTALVLATRCNHLECVKVLLEAGADVNAEDVVRENQTVFFIINSVLFRIIGQLC